MLAKRILPCLDVNAGRVVKGVNFVDLKDAGDPVELAKVGGGIQSLENIKILLRAGADKVSINSAAVRDPDLINRSSDRFGKQCIVVAIDARKRDNINNPGWDVYVRGGRKNTGLDAVSWAKEMAKRGAGELLVTSMDADGTQSGYDLELTRTIAEQVEIPVIASGGAGNCQHIYEALDQGKAEAALLASLLHFGQLSVAEIKAYLQEQNVPVRIS